MAISYTTLVGVFMWKDVYIWRIMLSLVIAITDHTLHFQASDVCAPGSLS